MFGSFLPTLMQLTKAEKLLNTYLSWRVLFPYLARNPVLIDLIFEQIAAISISICSPRKRKCRYEFNVCFLLVNLLLPLMATSQIREYISNHVSSINSAEFNDTNYSDLAPLMKAIGDKRVVMLGELFHGDGETMKLKSRVVRFLHEKMNFNVIVFESDFFAR